MPLRPPAGYVRPGYDPLEVANPPTGVAATAGDATASVAFSAPTDVGGSAITNYYAVSNPDQITASSVTSPIAVSGLTNGTNYTFTVWAENSYGPSAYSSSSGSVTPSPPYIEDVFSTYLYTGNDSTQTITNGIDLAGEGGLVWIKKRNAAQNNVLFDTERGMSYSSPFAKPIFSNLTNAQGEEANLIQSNNDGFSLGSNSSGTFNTASATYASWTFRKQPKFFDIVTYSGDDSSSRTIPHNLGSAPGCIIIKRTDSTSNWVTYHRGLTVNRYLRLNTSGAFATSTGIWGSGPTDTNFTVGDVGLLNSAGAAYVAYLFAHNAGGFGLTGTDNVISCGSYTGNGDTNGLDVNLGYEPQWVLVKESSASGNYWLVADNMRGMTADMTSSILYPNDSAAEISLTRIGATATGFKVWGGSGSTNNNGSTYIYIAIRRGPMKTPTSGTEVFDAGTRSGSGSVAKTNSDILTDLTFIKNRTSGGEYWAWTPRLNGDLTLQSNSTNANLTGAMATNPWDTMTGAFCAASNGATNSGSLIDYSFRRAPGFFDVVCWTTTGSTTTINHNLGAVPEMIIYKDRDAGFGWYVYSASLAATDGLELNSTTAKNTYGTYWNDTRPTASVFTSGASLGGPYTYVAYLFASCPGVSKVGSYTGTGTTQQINCGFTAGARFVLIKRTDSTGDWYVWDSARGIVAGNDPYLLLNSTAAEVTNTDYVDTYSAGFEISSTAPAAINANGGTFIFLAIA